MQLTPDSIFERRADPCREGDRFDWLSACLIRFHPVHILPLWTIQTSSKNSIVEQRMNLNRFHGRD